MRFKLEVTALGIANAALSQLSYIPNTVIIEYFQYFVQPDRCLKVLVWADWGR